MISLKARQERFCRRFVELANIAARSAGAGGDVGPESGAEARPADGDLRAFC